MRGSRRHLVFAAGGFVALLPLVWFAVHWKAAHSAVVRIGATHSPPFAVVGVVSLDDAEFHMAIGATRRGIAKAKILRSEIDNMARDCTLDRMQQRWFHITSDETRLEDELMRSRMHLRALLSGAALLVGLVVLLTLFIRRERRAQGFTAAVLNNAGGLIFICDPRGRIVRLNRACEEAVGKQLREIRGRALWDVLVPPDERANTEAAIKQLATEPDCRNSQARWHTPDRKRLFSWSNTAMVSRSGRLDYIIGTGIDISSYEAAEQKLGYEARHDPLTGLANRRHLLHEMTARMSSAREFSERFVAVFADFDHFKHINDTYGHEAGDAALSRFAEIVREELPPADLAGRLGGDEFCLLIGNPDPHPTLERIFKRLSGHQFRTAGGEVFHVSVTFGAASWNESMCEPTDLLRAADEALYEAKRHRRTPVSQSESERAELMRLADCVRNWAASRMATLRWTLSPRDLTDLVVAIGGDAAANHLNDLPGGLGLRMRRRTPKS